jgi:hypothetical protein
VTNISSFPEVKLSRLAWKIENMYVPLGATVIALGAVGAGKSEMVKSVQRKLAKADPDFGIGGDVFGLFDLPDVRGMVNPPTKLGFSSFAKPDWLRDCYYRERDGSYVLDGNGRAKLKPRGLFLVDEITQIQDPAVQNAMAPLLLDGYVGEHGLPRGVGGWCIVALGNRVEDRANAASLPTLVWNRADFACHVRAELEGWRAWAVKAGVPGAALTYARLEEGTVFSGRVPPVDGPFCTPRSLVKGITALDMYAQCIDFEGWPDRIPGEEGDGDDEAFEAMAGAIGVGAAAKFWDVVRHHKDRPTVAEIVADPRKAKLPQDGGVQYSLLDNLIVNLEEKNCEAICHYVKRLPRALAAVFCRWAFEKDARLTTVIGPTGLPTYAGASLGFAMEDQGR